MESKYFSVFNKTRQTYLSDQIRIVDAVLEPLKVLKVLIEGLDPRVDEGLWLTHFKGVPVARTLSPFDLIYLDRDYRVVHAVELTTDSDFAPFKGLPESALVLLPQTISSSGTQKSDLLILRVIEQRVPDMSRAAASPPSQQITPVGRSLRDLSSGTRFSNASFPGPSAQIPALPVDAFIPLHPSPSIHPAPTGRIPRGPAELPLSAPLPSTTSPVPAVQIEAAANPSPVEAPQHQAAQPGVVKPAKRRAPIPIQPIHEKPALPAQERSPAAHTHPVPGAKPLIFARPPEPAPSIKRTAAPAAKEFASPKPQPSSILAQAGVTLNTIPLTTPVLPAPNPPLGPRQLPGPLGEPPIDLLPPSPHFTDYSDVKVEATPKEPEKPKRAVQFLRWLFPDLESDAPQPVTDRRQAPRLPLPDLIAYFFTGGSPQPHPIQNISVTGFYMETEERWIPGTVIRMTLQRIGSRGDDPGDTISVHSRVVRWGPHGGGFEFVFSGLLD